jgi:hypothetical protein
VAGYVAAIKAAQEGLKVRSRHNIVLSKACLMIIIRLPASRNAAHSVGHA